MEPAISISTVTKIASIVIACLKESPLKKMARIEAEIAMQGCKDITKENNPREGLNRILTHLESSIGAYEETLGTWDIWDIDTIMWSQYSVYNKLCATIALVHYYLGNQKLVETWLLERMSPEGPWFVYIDSEEDLRELGLSISGHFDADFYKALLGDKYEVFHQNIIKPSDFYYETRVDVEPNYHDYDLYSG